MQDPGSLGSGDIADPDAEHKRTDFVSLRDFRLADPALLSDLALCYKYWIALTDCDGFRLDTLKHVSFEEARNFCGTIKEFAGNLGKSNFLLAGEVAGGDYAQNRFLDVLERNLDAGRSRPRVRLEAALRCGRSFRPSARGGRRTVALHARHSLHLLRNRAGAVRSGALGMEVAAGLGQLRSLPARGDVRAHAPATFGPTHPRRSGRAGLTATRAGVDLRLPGFGPFGTAGHHCFDAANHVHRRVAALLALRRQHAVLHVGRQYLRPFSFLAMPFGVHGPGELIAWSRILDDEEMLCIVNSHGNAARGGDIIVDAALNPAGTSLTVVLNTAEAATSGRYRGTYPVGSVVRVRNDEQGRAFVEVRDVPFSEVLVLATHAAPDTGGDPPVIPLNEQGAREGRGERTCSPAPTTPVERISCAPDRPAAQTKEGVRSVS